jgi:hypothetical protein
MVSNPGVHIACTLAQDIAATRRVERGTVSAGTMIAITYPSGTFPAIESSRTRLPNFFLTSECLHSLSL